MIHIKSEKEIEIMRQGGKILARVLQELVSEIKIGVSLNYLDDLAEKLILGYDAKPSFKGYKPAGAKKSYPASLCISLNNEVVHGVPDERRLKSGDVVSLDLGVLYGGYHTDSAITLGVGGVSGRAEELMLVTEGALDLAVDMVKPGVFWGDIAHEIQRHVESAKFSVVRELTGHGVGRGLQEDPYLPNYGEPGDEPVLKEGMVIAIEPMVAVGRPQVEMGLDGFVYQTKDKSLAAHFEHTVAVTKNGVEILTKI
ncbi:MAG: type I methionyl aminopeptidase [Candidatus Sungbacteria bacterium]|uniref:Methionine aminopeptidase n=1 Tax=Candidatus Sungiibacteriota bacterium TaxID=2750080 RepID=A0A931YD76_9BACT|nr:type I methionyl aminopeptidase [Candidatus Sungbacteria bacterium]